MTDPAGVTAFVNERLVRVSHPATARAAVHATDPALADALEAGRAYLTDGRGVPCDPDAPLAPGAILRVVIRRRPPGE